MRNVLFVCLAVIVGRAGVAHAYSSPRVQLSLDTSEAEQALRIIHKQSAGESIALDDWKRLFATVPYQWLRGREASMGRSFTDEEFQRFLLSPAAVEREREWEQTLADMRKADLPALGAGVLAWLPAGATITARVFPEIKPQHNSFVWTKQESGPAIFLYLERQTKEKFENTVAHECHHIGLESLGEQQKQIQARLPENVKTAMDWMGGFGEGEAMLAAAGSVDRHPHWEDDAVARARWDGDMMHFNADLGALQQFFTDIVDGAWKDRAAIAKRAAPFWGDVQGAWYTVGYEMASLVKREYGTEAFDECLLDPRKLLVFYNQIAVRANAKGATLGTWSPELLAHLNAF